MEEIKLKPCPFEWVKKDFKHEPEVIQPEGYNGLWQVCCQCGLSSPILGFKKQPGIDMYNNWNIQALKDLNESKHKTQMEMFK